MPADGRWDLTQCLKGLNKEEKVYRACMKWGEI